MATTFNKQLVVLATGAAIFLTLLAMPTLAGLTPEGQRMLAVTALMAIWWIGEGTSLAVTALLPLVLFPLLGILPSKLVATNYANHLIFLFLGGFMIALAMEKWNFHKRLALWIISAIGTQPQRLVLGFHDGYGFFVDVDLQHRIDYDDVSGGYGGGAENCSRCVFGWCEKR